MVEGEPTEPIRLLQSRPNGLLEDLLKLSDHPDVSVEQFMYDQALRLDVTDQARLTWFNSNLKDLNPLKLTMLGHSVEAASDQPDAEFLQHSIGEVLEKTTAQPTYFNVVPQVMGFLKEPDLRFEYLERMLAKPGEPMSGWVPVSSEDRQLLAGWHEEMTAHKVHSEIKRRRHREQKTRVQAS